MTTEPDSPQPQATLAPPAKPAFRRPSMAGTALAAVLIVGVAAGAGAMKVVDRFHQQAVLLLQPTPIGDLRENAPAAVKGRVGDRFGNSFVIADGSGRALVDTGRGGEGRVVVNPNETVTVQGRFDRGRLHAELLVHEDGRSESFDQPKPQGPGGPGKGPDGRRAERDAPPPPPGRGPDRDAPPAPQPAAPDAPNRPAQ